MGFLDKIKRLFTEEQIPLEKVSEVVGEKIVDSDNIQFSNASLISSNNEMLEMLNSFKIDFSSLALDRIESEAETLNNYIKGLIKDLSSYEDFKHEKDRIKTIISAIGGKIKAISNHGLELKNLLASLEDHYYVPILDLLKKANKKKNSLDITKIISDLENDLKLVRGLDTSLTKVIAYHKLFNPEKNDKHSEAIEKEAAKRIIHGDLNALVDDLLVVVVNKSLGIKNKIENNNPLEKAKQFV